MVVDAHETVTVGMTGHRGHFGSPVLGGLRWRVVGRHGSRRLERRQAPAGGVVLHGRTAVRQVRPVYGQCPVLDAVTSVATRSPARRQGGGRRALVGPPLGQPRLWLLPACLRSPPAEGAGSPAAGESVEWLCDNPSVTPLPCPPERLAAGCGRYRRRVALLPRAPVRWQRRHEAALCSGCGAEACK